MARNGFHRRHRTSGVGLEDDSSAIRQLGLAARPRPELVVRRRDRPPCP
jgi:hypothetical protein